MPAFKNAALHSCRSRGRLFMKKITAYMAKYKWRYIIGTVSLLIAVVIDNITPQVTKRIVDDVIGKGNTDILLPCLGIILAVTLGRTFFQYTKEYNFDMCGCGVATDLRKDLFRHVQGLSVDYFDETNTGEIM